MKKLHRRVLGDVVGDVEEEEEEEEDMGGVRNLGRNEKRRPGRQAGRQLGIDESVGESKEESVFLDSPMFFLFTTNLVMDGSSVVSLEHNKQAPRGRRVFLFLGFYDCCHWEFRDFVANCAHHIL